MDFKIQDYLEEGVEYILKDSMRACIRNPKEIIYLLKFSKHASQRLMDRNINLSEEQLNRLEKGAMLSSQKGIKESLVLMDELAFIINTGNNTVVTAMQKDNEGENIYTNIDGAVLV